VGDGEVSGVDLPDAPVSNLHPIIPERDDVDRIGGAVHDVDIVPCVVIAPGPGVEGAIVPKDLRRI